MSQITSGLYRLVTIPFVYRLIQGTLAGSSARTRLARELIRAEPGQRVLDLGCGSGASLGYLPDCDYIGVDSNPAHIEEAQRRHGGRGRFLVGNAAEVGELGRFDLVLGIGLLHHLGDDTALRMLKGAAARLEPGGRLFTIDPCYVTGQNPLAKFLIDRDSGRAVRDEAGYRGLGEQAFGRVETRILHDLLRVPYTHCVMDCGQPLTGAAGGAAPSGAQP